MSENGIDILMITYNRAAYTRLSLARLLETCDESCRVWLWHNGTDEETLDVVCSHLDHPRIHEFHHSTENRKLREPTNWLLENARGEYVSKVDDDCLVPHEWLAVLRKAHEDEPRFGAIGCWHFMPEDFCEATGGRKIQAFGGGHRVMCHPWIGGTGFLVKRTCVERVGLLRKKESGMTSFHLRVALKGWVNGWYYPFLWQEHMDDPRAPHSLLRTDEDLRTYMPLSATTFGAATLQEWTERLRADARHVQEASPDPREHIGWRPRWRRIRRRCLQALQTPMGTHP